MKSLLKQKSKVGIVQKERKKYDIADLISKKKRLETPSEEIKQRGVSQNKQEKFGFKQGGKIKPE